MRNKVMLKKYLLISFGFIFLFLCDAFLINQYEYQSYRRNFNQKIDEILYKIKVEYPNVSEEELAEILNNENTGTDLFEKYGIDVKHESVVIKNDRLFARNLLINQVLFFAGLLVLLIIFLLYNRSKDKEIQNITKCIQEINKKNYEINLDSMSEDELSILKNEIYKTTVMLKEAAENSTLDKKNLKKSLEDISHQLKTPLTSVLVILDNMIDEPEMEEETRQEFIMVIKREIVRMNFLIQALLKLSKFDANTIHLIRKEKKISEIIGESVKNVSALCDLKNVHLKISGEENAKVVCDFKWQVEAVTNIIKNCIEYSSENGEIEIIYRQNQVFSEINIKDFGEKIDEEDLPHVFERFYKGKNSSTDSVGIGLALSKSIVEQEGGEIHVFSSKDETVFRIRYYQ
ncbi:MAG: HAMP domain-containing histidine kinase [Lachnospiraceae bacterium]|nr:HAMP domain-containing histidine kinase [Lachnospiraceae bacterium]